MVNVKKVVVSLPVYGVCLEHALSNEKEEVMGLLLGEVDEETQISYVKASRILARSDKQPDRVEISPEQLIEASSFAEELSQKLGEKFRVLGWYHSHPHITVWPSHVDLKTQSMYQNMDKYFIGLIFSVFNASRGGAGNEIQVTCFQTAIQGKNSPKFSRSEITFELAPSTKRIVALESSKTLPIILAQEEQEHLENQGGQANDELGKLHNLSLETLQFVNLADKVSTPLVEILENQLQYKKERLKKLQAEIKKNEDESKKNRVK